MTNVPHGPTPGMNTRPHLEHVKLMFQRSKSIGQRPSVVSESLHQKEESDDSEHEE